MTQHADQIRHALASHEYLAPDGAAVYARAQELARTYRRRRVGAQAAGGAVLGASLVAGGMGLPSLLSGGSRATVIVQGPAAGGDATSTPPVTTPPSPSPEFDRDLEAYFDAGYELGDSKKLAKLWNLSSAPENLLNVKAEAGRRLLAGEKLPVKAAPAAVATAQEARATKAFFDAGYDYSDAKKLSKLWKTANAYEAKVLAGEKLLAGKKLPIKP